MENPNVLILSGYGINCERETKFAFELEGANAEIVHINDLINKEKSLEDYQILVFPGGFSYGDDTGSGNAFANKVRLNLWDELKKFIYSGKLILGICNGFQVLINLGLLPAINNEYGKRSAALISNDSHIYECRWVYLENQNSKCIFTKNVDKLYIPVAHGEGKFYAEDNILSELEQKGQIVFKYILPNGESAKGEFPFNPNGSFRDIAGICDETGRILGMMPHPERAIFIGNFPTYQKYKEKLRRQNKEIIEYYEPARTIFRNAVNYSKERFKLLNHCSQIINLNNIKNYKDKKLKTLMDGDTKEKIYKSKIRDNLKNVLSSGLIPELGKRKKGKVRDVYFKNDKIIMVASDRVSCFDNILSRRIPYKGIILNLFNKWAFENTKDIVLNALISSPDPSVVIQKRLKIIPFEFVVRGYVWGSMAQAYEEGEREFCGHKLSGGLLRYEKLAEPIFTPATKAIEGHDENVSLNQLAEAIGYEKANKLKEISINLFKRASEIAEKKDMIFIDTKYEFGEDENGDIYLIDEANTPDSSRYCNATEYKKFEEIRKKMISGNYKNVSELINVDKNLKIKELSKQFVRDVLVESGYKGYGGDDEVPELTDEQVVETSWRYISLYEDLTGEQFNFDKFDNIKQSLLSNLINQNLIKGGMVVLMAGSDSDREHIRKICDGLDKLEIAWSVRICSAHKQASKCEELINYYNESTEPLLIIAIAGGTDALSGVVSFHSVWPVISCPPDKNNYLSCIENPPGSSNALIIRPENVAKFAAQYFGYINNTYQNKILNKNFQKIEKLKQADEQFLKEDC